MFLGGMCEQVNISSLVDETNKCRRKQCLTKTYKKKQTKTKMCMYRQTYDDTVYNIWVIHEKLVAVLVLSE